ncbi:hypothetical protein FT663_04924 [Candidozyma haemuli var. vulneris]|uniref:Uncharacterized protein n=1 Tax=Candidozyma haemuli TaxID=45357 RepID=A0A2V1ARP9_9ASCO|nr:hypothetical protein CXQ85_002202 [[Candida] haemuloni]KAF3985689.1 hypothetical protein FT662_04999 [[Candida] haemuloni var. vulneris]KAF3986345.1 hypothetical protein FT663_04924 [[Candida] haemuloni var. vulneris]PVH20414.1 hypothetical protein CXQ85_002202 [[Candida] haemuloni]
MATTVKKKAVYVRGPNNIYRKKSYDAPSIASTDSVELTRRKGEVDSALNDLMVCGFQVHEDPVTKKANMKTKRPSASSADIPTRLTPERPPSPRISFKRSYSDLPKASESSWMDKVKQLNSRILPQSAGDFVLPYILGVLTAVIIQQKWDLLTRYARLVTHLLFIGIFWAVLAAGAFWYSGMLNVSSLGDIKNTFAGLFGSGGISASSNSPVNYHYERRGRRSSSLDDAADTESILSSEAESEYDPKTKMRTESEPLLVRDPSPQKLTNVRPFVPPPRRDSADSKLSHVPQPPLSRLHTADGSGVTRKSRFRLGSPEREKYKDPRRHSSASLELSSKDRQKPLPSLNKAAQRNSDSNGSDLPLVHEIKLKSRFDQQLQALENDGPGLGRSDTMFSKQSMLGTRANKRTFLSNVDET